MGKAVAEVSFLSTPSARRATCQVRGKAYRQRQFLSTPSARRATESRAESLRLPPYFYPRPPRGGRLEGLVSGSADEGISIHALREEGDVIEYSIRGAAEDFYPRPPRGGRLNANVLSPSLTEFLSTPSARRATWPVTDNPPTTEISIHALREEGDGRSQSPHNPPKNFYPRPPRGGRRVDPHHSHCHWCDFYPRPPRGGRPFLIASRMRSSVFLSTPSARRATRSGARPRPSAWYFYPRPPRGGRRIDELIVREPNEISIHALREEGDCAFWRSRTTRPYFYPRPPRGGRLMSATLSFVGIQFLSTPSARRATPWLHRGQPQDRDFYPRPPRGGRPLRPGMPLETQRRFLSTPSARRATSAPTRRSSQTKISIHALREEGDTSRNSKTA